MGHLKNSNSMENSISIEIYSNKITLSTSDCSSSSPLESEIPRGIPLLWTVVLADSGLFIWCNGKPVVSHNNVRDVSCLKTWVTKFSDSLFGRKAIRFPEKNAVSIYYRSKPSGTKSIEKENQIFSRPMPFCA